MNFTELICNFDSFDNLKKGLKKEYKLQVKHTNNLYIINIQKNKINTNPILNIYNGQIYEKKTNKLVCNMYPIVKEYPDCYQYDNFDDLIIEEAIDGTLIKLYYYNNEWNVATNRCIDAKESYWISNKSFYDLFTDAAVNLDIAKLNTSYCYAFILQHPSNRNVKRYENPNLIYVYSYDLVNNVIALDNSLSHLDRPKRYKFNNWDEIINSLPNLNYDNEGYIIYNKNQEITKVVNPNFKKVKDLKGNTPDINYRCLVLYKYGRTDEFLSYYPEYVNIFKSIKLELTELVNKLYMLYVSKYIKKERVQLPKQYNIVLYHIHNDYMKSNNNDRMISRVKVTAESIYNKIIGYSPLRIYEFIKKPDLIDMEISS